MKRSTRFFVSAGTALVVSFFTVVLSGSQGAPPSSPQRPPMAETVFKNIQVLKGIPVDEFMGTMGFFATATGLNCTDCHVDESGGSWARYADDNALKQQTRRMVVMMRTINQQNFGGRQVVTCYTCQARISPMTKPGGQSQPECTRRRCSTSSGNDCCRQ